MELARQAFEQRQARKPGERVEFRPSGQLEPPKQAPPPSQPAASAASDPPKRKSKWDTGGEPSAKRPFN